MRIDAHQHFWTLERTDYGWLTPAVGPIYRDYQPADLQPLLEAADIDGTIVVQAAPTVAETDYMLSLADRNAFIKGVVGWVDFERPEAIADIERLCRHPAFVGIRPMIQDITDDNWVLRDDLAPVFDAVIAKNLTFDALTFPRHLPNLITLIERRPDLRVVIDHASKPAIHAGRFDGWREDMATLARETTALCKLSGMVTEAGADWTIASLRPYADHLLSTFGPQRLIWGSDWPVLNLAGDYGRWIDATETLLAGLSSDERAAIMGENARKAYRLRA